MESDLKLFIYNLVMVEETVCTFSLFTCRSWYNANTILCYVGNILTVKGMVLTRITGVNWLFLSAVEV